MERKTLKRAVEHRPRQQSRGFTYRPREKAKPRPSERAQRAYTRRALMRAALEEFHLGNDSLTALYASLLVHALVRAEPDLKGYGRAVERALQD